MDEVDTMEANNHQWMEDSSSDLLLSSTSPDIFGEPQVSPRIGDEYQVGIPPLMTEIDVLKSRQSASRAEEIVYIDCPITIGLPIPVMWVRDVVDLREHRHMDSLSSRFDSSTTSFEISENGIVMNSEKNGTRHSTPYISDHSPSTSKEALLRKPECMVDASDCGNDLGSFKGNKNMVLCKWMAQDLPLPQYQKSDGEFKIQNENCYPVPGSISIPWSDFERESFLLGLYIFGKNLVQVKRFIESKGMGDILSFYYGQFYRSEQHRRWYECHKMKSRRCIYGQRIFTGWRQQELLTRLQTHVSGEYTSTLVEVSKTFSEGKFSFEEYVSTIKDVVGLNALVETIGIGKGKHDLTGIVVESTKTNHLSTRSEIPVGKACSSLTSAEIIKYLTGDFRLSKGRSNDLFWEAVWPRLLARGWHSEQPRNQGYVDSRHLLVFLVPGIKKFSKRKLVKGNDYFDSISDVLNKVASEPNLLEIEAEAVNGSRVKEEYGWDLDAKLDRTGPSDHQRPLYLCPRVPNCSSELMKFTIVDTSLAHGEQPYKVRELRSLPVDCTQSSISMKRSRESDSESSEEEANEPESTDNSPLDDQEESRPSITKDKKLGKLNFMHNAGVHSNVSSYLTTLSKKWAPLDGLDSVNMSDNHEKGKVVKCQFRRRTKPGRPNYLSPVIKQRCLSACHQEENKCHTKVYSVVPKLKEEPDCRKFLLEGTMAAEGSLSQWKVPTGSSGKCSPNESNECVLGENCVGASKPFETISSQENPKPQTMIDLNLPQVPPDFDTGATFNAYASDCQNDLNMQQASSQNQQPEKSSLHDAQPPVANVRRQSTRNRPLTTRVLEALECGFFSSGRRGRGTTKALARRNTMPRSSRQRVHDRGGFPETVAANSGIAGTGSLDSKVDEMDECSSYVCMLDKPQMQSERKENSDLPVAP